MRKLVNKKMLENWKTYLLYFLLALISLELGLNGLQSTNVVRICSGYIWLLICILSVGHIVLDYMIDRDKE